MKDKLMGSLITIAIILAAAAAIWFGFFRSKTYDTAVVVKSDLQEVVSESGTIISNRTKTYYANSDDTIDSLTLKVGDTVEKDEQLFHTDSTDSSVNADFTGVLTDLQVAEGSYVPAGSPLMTLADPQNLAVAAEISQEDIDKLALSQKAEITLGDYHYSGNISRIAELATPSSGKPKVTVEIKINNPDTHLYMGAEADVEIYSSAKDSAVVIPVEAVYADADNDFVYVIEDGKVQRKTVTIGISSKVLSEVTEGLVVGDVVITGPVTDSERGKRAVAAN